RSRQGFLRGKGSGNDLAKRLHLYGQRCKRPLGTLRNGFEETVGNSPLRLFEEIFRILRVNTQGFLSPEILGERERLPTALHGNGQGIGLGRPDKRGDLIVIRDR